MESKFKFALLVSICLVLVTVSAQQQQRQCPLFQVQHSVIPMSETTSVAGTNNDYKIMFVAQSGGALNVGSVDVHWRIVRAGGVQEPEVNERMNKVLSATNSFERGANIAMPIRLNAGDCIQYWFTYVVLMDSFRIDCDTDKFSSCPQPQSTQFSQVQVRAFPTTTAPISSFLPTPAPFIQQSSGFPVMLTPAPLTQQQPQQQQLQCPLFPIQHAVVPISGTDQLKIQFNALTQMDVLSVDLHWQIKRGSGFQDMFMNERMTKKSSTSFERDVSSFPIRLNAGDCLHYWFTYSTGIGQMDCDTERFINCAGSATPQQQALFQDVSQQPFQTFTRQQPFTQPFTQLPFTQPPFTQPFPQQPFPQQQPFTFSSPQPLQTRNTMTPIQV
jgi:uncharacterized protein with PIN domain